MKVNKTVKKVLLFAAIYEGAAYAVNWFSYNQGYGVYLPLDFLGQLTKAPWQSATAVSGLAAYMPYRNPRVAPRVGAYMPYRNPRVAAR